MLNLNMNTNMKLKKSSVSKQQKEGLIDFMEAHPDLMRGKFSATFTTNVAKNLWQQCAELLNAIPGPTKEWNEWRKVKLFVNCI